MKQKLKIGVVVDQLLAGGVQLAAIEQVKELTKLGNHAKLLILMRKKYPTDFSYLVKDIPFQYLSDLYPTFFQKTFKFPIFSFFSTLHLASPFLASRVIKKNDYDMLISLGTTTCLTTQAIFKKRKIPYIAVIHDPIEYILQEAYSKTPLKYFFFILKPIARLIEKSFVKDAKKTLIISKVHNNYLQKNYGISPIILGFGSHIFSPLPKKRGKTILSFGRWQKEKNPDLILKLAKKIPKVQFVIAGNWTEPKELEQFENKIQKDKLQNRISIYSNFDEKLLSKLCKDARCFLYPHFEAFGLAALEAAGHGLPIIVPKNSGVTEYFKHGIHGFFPKRGNISEYKKYLELLISDEEMANKMGIDAWIHIKNNFSWSSNTKTLLELIKDVLKQKPTILVLEIGHAIGKTLAGGDKLMEPMAKRLSDMYQFLIIVPKIGAWHWKSVPIQKEIIILPKTIFDTSGSTIFVFIAYCIRMLQTIKILAAKKTIDILYSSTNILPDILPIFIARTFFIKKRWIARVHHIIPPPNKREGSFIVNIVSYGMQKIALFMIKQKADLIIALNDNLRNQLIQTGFPKHRLNVLGAGIDYLSIRQTKNNLNVSFDGIFLGRLHPSKGIYDLIPIWKNVLRKHPHAKLAVIGVGLNSTISHLERKLKEEQLTKNIFLLGFLPNEKLYPIMKNSKIFLFTDHEAGWGLAVGEAMAAGLPVVGYDTGVLGTVFKKGYCTIPLGKHSQFSNELIELLKNEKYRKKLSKEAISEASRHDWKITSDNFIQFLKKFIVHE